VARTSWFDERGEYPAIHERINHLESFTTALADGVVAPHELADQELRLTAAMRRLEPELGDGLHAKVTDVLVELSAYNIMRLLHELRVEQVRGLPPALNTRGQTHDVRPPWKLLGKASRPGKPRKDIGRTVSGRHRS
jgi:hypothetical protein